MRILRVVLIAGAAVAAAVGARPAGAAAGAAAGDSLTVRPAVIYTNAPAWTFLVQTADTTAADPSVVLLLGQTALNPVTHERSRAGTTLWDFQYPPVENPAPVKLVVTLAGRRIAVPIEPRSPVLNLQDPQVGGAVEVRLKTGTLAWKAIRDSSDPAYNLRTPDQLACADPVLAALMAAIAVSRVSSANPGVNDADTVLANPAGGFWVRSPAVRSRYNLYYSTTHSGYAIAEILKTSPAVLEAGPMIVGGPIR